MSNFFSPKVILITDQVQNLIIQFLRFQETRPTFSSFPDSHTMPLRAATANILVSAIMSWLIGERAQLTYCTSSIASSVGPSALHSPRVGAQPTRCVFPRIFRSDACPEAIHNPTVPAASAVEQKLRTSLWAAQTVSGLLCILRANPESSPSPGKMILNRLQSFPYQLTKRSRD